MDTASADPSPASGRRTACAAGCGLACALVLLLGAFPPARRLTARLLIGSAPESLQAPAIGVARLLGGDAAVEPLVEVLERDPSPSARARAAWALGEEHVRSEPAVPALTRALRDEHVNVRYHAAVALSMILPYVARRHPEAEAALATAAAEDADASVREWAAQALESIPAR